MRVRIKSMESLTGLDESKEFEKFNLKIGDEIEVVKFTGNAVWYQPIKKGKVLFIYNWNIEKL